MSQRNTLKWRTARAGPAPAPGVRPHPGCPMNFHEYQAKQLFGDYGIAVPKG